MKTRGATAKPRTAARARKPAAAARGGMDALISKWMNHSDNWCHVEPDMRRSRGSYLYDRNWRADHGARGVRLKSPRVLDFYTDFSSTALGWNHPALVDPRFRAKLGYLATRKFALSDVHPPEFGDFLQVFLAYARPRWAERVFFVEGGAAAVENALKTAFDWKLRRAWERDHPGAEKPKLDDLDPGRGRIIHLKGAFHGRSGYTMSLTNTTAEKTAGFPQFQWPRIQTPGLRFDLDGNVENLHDVEGTEREAVAEVRRACSVHGDQIAALIVEPIQGEGGDVHFRGEFLRELRALADRHDFLLIFDEIQTGFGLTGKMWAHEHFGVAPDLMVFGKKTQICGFFAGPRVLAVKDNVFDASSRINSTWGGNLVDMVRCQRILETMKKEKLVANAAKTGAWLLRRLRRTAREVNAARPGLITNVRGRGLMIAFDCPDRETRELLRRRCLQEGIFLLLCGARSIRLRPPLTVTRQEAEEAAQIIARAAKLL